jgi:hypothetical protein
MSVVARQFANPQGLLGWLVGRGMARSNGNFSRWTVLQIEQHLKQPPRRIVEIGPGPGIGLEELLRRFPEAQVWGVDRSGEMLRQSRRRYRDAVEGERLTLCTAMFRLRGTSRRSTSWLPITSCISGATPNRPLPNTSMRCSATPSIGS